MVPAERTRVPAQVPQGLALGDWPGAWAADAGIDLVAEEHGGGLWAIQAKAYDPRLRDQEGRRRLVPERVEPPGFTYRLLIATTDRLGPTARRTLDDQREPVGYLLRSQLELAQVAWPASPDDLRPRRPARKKPFPHVQEAIRATVKGFDAHRPRPAAHGLRDRQDAGGDVDRRAARRASGRWSWCPRCRCLAQTLREWNANATKPSTTSPSARTRRVAGEDEFVAAHLGAGRAGHDRPRADRSLPATPGTAGRVRHLPVLAADRRRLRGPGPARSTSRSPTRRTAARGASGTEFTTILDPRPDQAASGGCS